MTHRRLHLTVLLSFFVASSSLAFAQRDWWELPAAVDGLAIERPYEVFLFTEDLDGDALALGITDERILTMVRTFLRELGVTVVDESYETHWIGVSVLSLSTAAHVSMVFMRGVEMMVDGEAVPKQATVWRDGTLLTFGAPSSVEGDRVMEALGAILGRFATDFVVANP